MLVKSILPKCFCLSDSESYLGEQGGPDGLDIDNTRSLNEGLYLVGLCSIYSSQQSLPRVFQLFSPAAQHCAAGSLMHSP